MKVLKIILPLVLFSFILNGQIEPAGNETRDGSQDIKLVVRVRQNNHWVGGLNKENFKVYENGKLQLIVDFEEINKKLAPAGNPGGIKNENTSFVPRQFLLMFYFTDFNEKLSKSIEYLFGKIIVKNDKLTILVNNMLVNEHRVVEPSLEKRQLTDFLKKVGSISAPKLRKLFYDMEMLLQQTIRETVCIPVNRVQHPVYLPDRLIKSSENFEKYIGFLNYYKNHFLFPNLKQVTQFAQNQQSGDMEKWVIHFFQTETFPLISLSRKDKSSLERIIRDSISYQVGPCADSARLLKRSLDRLTNAIDMASQYPEEKLSRFFYHQNATCFTFFIPSTDELISKDNYFIKTCSELKAKFDKICILNGGQAVVAPDPETELEKITEADDVVYYLAYTPEKINDTKRKIKIKLDRKDCDIFFIR